MYSGKQSNTRILLKQCLLSTQSQRLTEDCKTNFLLPVNILQNTALNLLPASDENKLQKEKHCRRDFPYGVYFLSCPSSVLFSNSCSLHIQGTCNPKLIAFSGKAIKDERKKMQASFFCFYQEVKSTQKEV